VLIDAHNHLQDERLASILEESLAECERIGVRHAVVNGTHPRDWPRVAALAQRCSWVLPSFGVHPWYIDGLPTGYLSVLGEHLDRAPSVIGEIGIDHWKEGIDRERQEVVFLEQLSLARSRNLPVTIHGLKAWSRLLELLRAHGAPAKGFLLHSYSGPRELVEAFANLGGYFSVAPAFLDPQRHAKRELFRHIPTDRILLETDAPDQGPTRAMDLYRDDAGRPLNVNHPGNIQLVYSGMAQLLGLSRDELAERMRDNFTRLFGGLGGLMLS
jgi:TatD DNase family protein